MAYGPIARQIRPSRRPLGPPWRSATATGSGGERRSLRGVDRIGEQGRHLFAEVRGVVDQLEAAADERSQLVHVDGEGSRVGTSSLTSWFSGSHEAVTPAEVTPVHWRPIGSWMTEEIARKGFRVPAEVMMMLGSRNV